MKENDILYTSTRSDTEKITSVQAIIKGIAPDGGLYVPERIPAIDVPFSELVKMDYRQLSFYIMSKFLTDFTPEELDFCISRAYDEKFDNALIAPLVKAGNMFFLELYHGATAAFKDMALSVLPYLLTTALKKSGIKKEIVILTATSGDTGKAALESFSGVAGTKVIVFYPKGKVSPIQERQMTTQESKNTFVCAIEGNFDDAQTGVKSIFSDRDFNELAGRKNYLFSSANSINIGRLIPQVAYYVHVYLRLLQSGEITEGEEINVVVPTGNFGNILASYYAREMGLPIGRFICASNENNVLYDFINTGVYNKNRKLKLTASPSMDILVSSNLERLIYDLCERDSSKLAGLFDSLAKTGTFSIDESMRDKLASFWGGYATEAQTFEAIGQAYREHKYLIDTHTAVGYFVYKDYLESTSDKTKTVIASTASPFKFPGSVLKAISGDFSAYENLDEFEMLSKLSEITGLKIPKSLQGMAQKQILHDSVCGIGDMKQFIARTLAL
ncbi:MAG TPA: threonine synthase [Candidatus Humimicrobiaceae bacterium]